MLTTLLAPVNMIKTTVRKVERAKLTKQSPLRLNGALLQSAHLNECRADQNKPSSINSFLFVANAYTVVISH